MSVSKSKVFLGTLSPFTFNGSIDDFAIWDTTLTNSQILAVYNSSPLSNSKLQKDNTDFNIFPNPASSEINISLDIKKESKLLISNELGQIIKNIILTQDNTKIDISDLNKGIYFLLVDNKSKKLIIN